MKEDEEIINSYLKKYERAKLVRQRWESLFDECYEFALPMRQTFGTNSIGERRDDKIFGDLFNIESFFRLCGLPLSK